MLFLFSEQKYLKYLFSEELIKYIDLWRNDYSFALEWSDNRTYLTWMAIETMEFNHSVSLQGKRKSAKQIHSISLLFLLNGCQEMSAEWENFGYFENGSELRNMIVRQKPWKWVQAPLCFIPRTDSFSDKINHFLTGSFSGMERYFGLALACYWWDTDLQWWLELLLPALPTSLSLYVI